MFTLFARCNSAYDVGAVFQTVFGIAGGDSSCESLVDDAGVLSNAEVLYCVFV